MKQSQQPPPITHSLAPRVTRRGCLQLASSGAMGSLVGAVPLMALASINGANPLLLPSTELIYDLEGMQDGLRYNASATLRWQRNSTSYQAELSARILVVFKRRQTSQGRIAGNALQPTVFSDEGKRIRQAAFDPVGKRISYTESGDAPWSEPTQDRLSVYFMLPQRIAQARFNKQTAITLPVSSANSLSTWQLRMGGREIIDTPMGQWSTQTLTRDKQEVDDTAAKLWFGGVDDLLPLRIRLEDSDSTWLEQRLRSHRPLDDLA